MNGTESSATSEPLVYERARQEHGPAVVALFERVGCPCFCRYWDFPGDARQWQGRCATDSATSRNELLAALAAPPGSPEELLAVVALLPAREGPKCVGWMRLAAPSRMGKAYEGRLYRGLPCFAGPRSDVLTVACFLVDDEHRRQGVARQLLAHGIELARTLGARTLEALPRRAEDVPAEQLWMGPPTLFEEQGFAVVHDFEPYPVFRLEL